MTSHKYAKMKLLEYPNCSGLTESGKCRWLTCGDCRGPDCSYLKISPEDALRKTFLRLASLDEETQVRISRKYYGGSRPWA
jgi:hypothetical protein